MFWMITMDESQWDLLCIVRRNAIEDPVRTTVTYDTTNIPYLATNYLKQLSIHDGEKYPLAAEALNSDA